MKQLRHPKADEITLAGVLAALSDPVRLAIVRTLEAAPGEHPWGDLDVGLAASTLSHHLKILRQAGLIRHRKHGTRCYVALNPDFDRVFPGLLACVLRLADDQNPPVSPDAP
jgi:DNA-binding transcriptional ArsR family regulator